LAIKKERMCVIRGRLTFSAKLRASATAAMLLWYITELLVRVAGKELRSGNRRSEALLTSAFAVPQEMWMS
jgi:hypothetical protein